MRFFPRLRAAVLLVCASVPVSHALFAQQYTFRQYGPSDGLTNLGINCLLQDQTGYLWVGTDNGLFRYDGSTFQDYGHTEGLPHVEIRSMALSPQGELWVATQDGVARSVKGRFESIDTGVKGVFLGLAFDSQGRLYLEHTTGILRGTADSAGKYRFTMVEPGNIGGLFIHGEDVWFRRDGDLWRLNLSGTERVGSPAGLPLDRWGSIALDTFGNLWVRSATHLYERPSGQTHFVDRSEGIPPAMVNRLFADAHGRLYVASNSGALLLDGLNEGSPTRTYIDPKHGLPSDVVAPILVDRDESLWFGMRGGGLIRRLGHGEWLSWKKQDGLLNDSVWSSLRTIDGRLWVGSSGGLNVFAPDGTLAHSWTPRNRLPGENVFAIAAGPGGEVFVGTGPAGVARFSQQGELLHSYNPASGWASEQVNALAFDRHRRLWAAASNGIFRTQAPVDSSGSLKFERVDIPGIPSGIYYHDVQVDDSGLVWITSANGLIRFDEAAGNPWSIFTEHDGLVSSDVSGMTVGHNEVWVAFRDALGIARVQFTGKQVKVTNITQKDGLSSDLIYALAFDHKGHLWASTDNGVDVLDGGRWRHYGMDDGLIWDDGNDHALSVDEEDNVWVGTSRGLSRFSAPTYPIPDPPSAIVLTSIRGISREFQQNDQPTLPHSQNSLQFQFSGLNYSSESHTRYRYRLVGSKSSWQETTERSVRFEGLSGGTYVFEVVAAGSNGQWSSAPAQFRFIVKPPWWLTWWFLGACLVVMVVLARAIWRFRVRTLLAQKKLLEQQVIDRTAELRESHRQLEEIAYLDSLTSLPNRRLFTEEFRNRVALSRRHGLSFALLVIDLDTFKQINDTHGHDAGDVVLIESAKLLSSAVRESDCTARLGGDEFAILLASPTDPEGFSIVCKRIVERCAAGIPFQDTLLKVSCSIGIAVFPADGDTMESLYKSADIALYQAKRAGGNTACRYSPQAAVSTNR